MLYEQLKFWKLCVRSYLGEFSEYIDDGCIKNDVYMWESGEGYTY